MTKKTSPPLSEEDRAFWNHLKSQIKPLKNLNKVPAPLPPLPKVFPKEFYKRVGAEMVPLDPLGSTPFSHEPSSRLKACAKRPSLEGRLDLHGLTLSQAVSQVQNFICKSQERGHRCVLIITGKGRERDREEGEERRTLRQSLPLWLNQLPQSVGSFSLAKPQDGGEGALYVFLKKREKLF